MNLFIRLTTFCTFVELFFGVSFAALKFNSGRKNSVFTRPTRSGVPAEVKILTVGTASTTGVALTSGSRNYTSADASKYQLFNPRSAKIIVSVATSEGTVEYNELSLVMHQNVGVGSEVAWETYGQL